MEFQLAPQGYRFPAGRRLKLELTANDAPYYQASNIPAVVTVGDVELVLPLREAPAAPTPGPTGPPPATGSPDPGPGGRLPDTGARPTLAVPLALLVLAAGIRARRRTPA